MTAVTFAVQWYLSVLFVECFKEKFTDPDDKVRATACKIMREIGIENDSASMDKDLVELVAARAKDKKVSNADALCHVSCFNDMTVERCQSWSNGDYRRHLQQLLPAYQGQR